MVQPQLVTKQHAATPSFTPSSAQWDGEENWGEKK